MLAGPPQRERTVRLGIFAVGKLKRGPEADLVTRYLGWAEKLLRQSGVSQIMMSEWQPNQANDAAERKRTEGDSLIRALPPGAVVVALDERGRDSTTDDFADWMTRQIDDRSTQDLVFIIGGPDGLDDAVRQRADKLLCFGSMTWPHQMVRAMLAEQIYRIATILAGHPYHRR